jgi:hypothetical protein
MTFASGVKVTADIVEEIANKLIATTEGYWVDITTVDAGATAWTTSNKTANNAKRALRYNNGVETPIFLAMEIINTYINYYYVNSPWVYGKGIRIVMSPSWDSGTHSYPTTGIQSTFMPFESCYNCGVSADLATMLVTYYLWTESNGFVVMGKPEPVPADSYQQSFIFVTERTDTINKRYIDGYSNFFVYKTCNIYGTQYDGSGTGGGVTSLNRDRQILRPFAYQWPDDTSKAQYGLTINYTTPPTTPAAPNGYGISLSSLPYYYAYKSAGNGKVYYVKPIIHNQGNSITPIFQSNLFFAWSETVGLIDGDIVAVQGLPVKYLCKSLDSPDSTNRLTYAIKYQG